MTGSPIKVLHCIGSMNQGGAETWLMRVLRRIDRQQFHLDFCCLSGQPGAYASEIEALGRKIHPCKASRNLVRFNRDFGRILDGGYDIVHSHVHYFSGYLLWRAKAAGVRGRIAHSHTTLRQRNPSLGRIAYLIWMRNWIHKYANAGVAVSHGTAQTLWGRDWQQDNRWRVIYCGIDLPDPHLASPRDQVRQALGISPTHLLVGHVGNFYESKNHKFLVDVAHAMVRRNPRTSFLLVGDGPLKERIEGEVQRMGLEDHFIFAGLRPDVPRLLSAMDLFLMPSRYEGLPIAGLEAQAAGLPVVFSDAITREACVVTELVTYLSLDSPSDEWASQLLALAGRRMDAINCRAAFQRKGFSIEASVNQLAVLYRSLVGEYNA